MEFPRQEYWNGLPFLCISRISFRFEGDIGFFTDKQNLDQHHRTGFIIYVKVISLNEKTNMKNMKIIKGKKLIGNRKKQ